MDLKQEVQRQMEILTEGVEEMLPAGGLEEKVTLSLRENRPLRVKLGIDPTSRDVHLGHMVTYRKMRQFQDLGHRAVLIIGDFTAIIGDPTGKNRERPKLTRQQVAENSQTYCDQIFKLIDPQRAEIHFQSSWFEKASLQDTLEQAGNFSVAHLLSHETFRSRLDQGTRLSLHELLYPVLQAWDSLQIHADIEMGGMDQKFNILCGRDLQKSRDIPAQSALFMPLLPGTDGLKMSKTGGNHIAVLDSPEEMYGKLMSLSDDLMDRYITLACTPGKDFPDDPYKRKRAIALDITTLYHGETLARRGEAHFTNTVSRKQIPEKIPQVELPKGEYMVAQVLKQQGLMPSVSEAGRLISQGGCRVDGKKWEDRDRPLAIIPGQERVLQAGKRKFLRLIGT